MANQIIKIIELDFVTIELYEGFIVTTFKEGIILNDQNVKEIHTLTSEFYSSRMFGYISNRIFDYSRNLSAEAYNLNYPNLTAIAIVYKSNVSLQIAHFEKFFIKSPFKTFTSLDDAKMWMTQQLQEA